MFHYQTELVYEHFIAILPQAKQSTQFNRKNGHAFTDTKKKAYVRQLVYGLKKVDDLFEGPLDIDLTFYFPFRKKENKADLDRGWMFHTVKPDRDNLCKPVFDAMEGVVLEQDQQIFSGGISKYRSLKQPGIKIEIYKATYA